MVGGFISGGDTSPFLVQNCVIEHGSVSPSCFLSVWFCRINNYRILKTCKLKLGFYRSRGTGSSFQVKPE